MKKPMQLIFVMAVFSLMQACISVNSLNQTDVTKLDFSKNVKIGESCQGAILGIPVGEPPSVKAAAKSARIAKVGALYSSFAFYIVYSKRCLIVEGVGKRGKGKKKG